MTPTIDLTSVKAVWDAVQRSGMIHRNQTRLFPCAIPGRRVPFDRDCALEITFNA